MHRKLGATVTKFFQTRDELSYRNIRGKLWPYLLVFPVSVIMGNLRYFDHSIALAGFATNELTFILLGLGWLLLAITPKRFIIPLLRLSAVISAVLLALQIFMPVGLSRFAFYLAFKFSNGLCTACAFYLFCFVLNNVERLFGMALIQLYYSFYYITRTALPFVHAALNDWGGIVITAVYLVIVFFCCSKEQEINTNSNLRRVSGEVNRMSPLCGDTDSDGKGSGVHLVIGLGVVHYMIMCMVNYIEWAENSVSSFAFGLGTLIAIVIILVIQLLKGRNALYIWILFLVLSLSGLGAMLYDTPGTIMVGSFAYGLGDSLGYIIIYYMCAGAIKRSKSLRMFRLYCLVFFLEYFIISDLFSVYFNYFDSPNKVLAFGVVMILVSLCFLFMPLIQKRLFEADWTDGLYLRDMEEYSRPLAETEAINAKEHLDLTPREQEIFAMLLSGAAPKEIAHTLKISYDTVLYHQKKLYRKLGIQSRAELFARYSKK